MTEGERSLFLHEVVDIVGDASWAYMEHTLAAAGDERVNFALQGTFSVLGITGRWPQVVNLWEIPGGWDGWRESVDRLSLRRRENQALAAWWGEAYRHRSGGFDRLLGAAPACPTTAKLVREGVRGTLFVHEVAEVRPGAALDYLAAVAEVRVPLWAEHGHRATGLYEVLYTDTEAITVWATDVDAHVALCRAGDVGDDRLVAWRTAVRELVVRRREELMTPCPGVPIGPEGRRRSLEAGSRRADAGDLGPDEAGEANRR